MIRRSISICLLALVAASIPTSPAFGAACVNRFLARQEKSKRIITLLTGKLTFQEAQSLVAAVNSKKAPPIEWVDEKGKIISKSLDLKVVRPMPVGCDGRTSGVVMIASFLGLQSPSKKMFVKFNPNESVLFEEQAE